MKKFFFPFFLIPVLSLSIFSQQVLYSDNLNVLELPEFSEPSSEPLVKKIPSGLTPGKVFVPPRQLTAPGSPEQESLLLGAGSYESFILGVFNKKTTREYQFQQKKISRSIQNLPLQEISGKISIYNLKGNLFYYLAPEITDVLVDQQRKTTFCFNPNLRFFLNKDNYLELESRMNYLNLNNTFFANNILSLDYFHYFSDWLGISLGAKKEWLGQENKFSELSSAKISLLLSYPEWLSGQVSVFSFTDDRYFYSTILTLVPFPQQRFQLSYQQNYQYFILTELYLPNYIYISPTTLPPADESSQINATWQYFFRDKFTVSVGYKKVQGKNSPLYFTPLDNSGKTQNYVDINYYPDLTRDFWTLNATEKAGIFNFQQNLTFYVGEKITYQPELTGAGQIFLNFSNFSVGTKYKYRSKWYYNIAAAELPENKFLSLSAGFYLSNSSSLNLDIDNITGEKIYHHPNYSTNEPLIFLTFIAKI